MYKFQFSSNQTLEQLKSADSAGKTAKQHIAVKFSLTATAKWSHNIFKDCLSGLHWSVIRKCDFIAFLWSFKKQYLPTFTVLCILFAIVVKGIVHPKRKRLSTFTHTHVVPDLYDFLSSMELQRRYSEECWKSVATVYCLVPHILIIFCDQQKNSGLEQVHLLHGFLRCYLFGNEKF